jgi:hypothetical protein
VSSSSTTYAWRAQGLKFSRTIFKCSRKWMFETAIPKRRSFCVAALIRCPAAAWLGPVLVHKGRPFLWVFGGCRHFRRIDRNQSIERPISISRMAAMQEVSTLALRDSQKCLCFRKIDRRVGSAGHWILLGGGPQKDSLDLRAPTTAAFNGPTSVCGHA